MPNQTIKDLLAQGVSRGDIELAKATQAAQRRAGHPVQALPVICGAATPRTGDAGGPNAPHLDEFTRKALRRRGAYDQAALLLEQQARNEDSPERATRAQEAADTARDLSRSKRIEWDFFGGGNVSFSHQFHDAITQRLKDANVPLSQRERSQAVLYTIIRHLKWQSFECSKVAADLCEITDIGKPNMATTLNLLEEVGAITRIKRGRLKIITVNPEAAYRGNVHNHGKVVELYALDVIEGGKPAPEPDGGQMDIETSISAREGEGDLPPRHPA